MSSSTTPVRGSAAGARGSATSLCPGSGRSHDSPTWLEGLGRGHLIDRPGGRSDPRRRAYPTILQSSDRHVGQPGLPAPLGTRSLRTHNFAPDARRRPAETAIRTALSPRYLIRPAWPVAATMDENRCARPSSALLGASEPVDKTDAGAFPAPRTVAASTSFSVACSVGPAGCGTNPTRRCRRWR
jgi:hypothetical protein